MKAEAALAKHMNPPVEEFIPPVVDEALEQEAFGKPQRMWIGFKANLTVEEAHQLKNFFDCRGIAFEQIEIQKGENNMATSVQITLIICVTLVAIMIISNKNDKNGKDEK